MITTVVDWAIGLGLSVARWAATVAYPYLRSKTGHANPRVRHLVSRTYGLHDYWMVRTNIEKWPARREALFPAVVQVQTVNRCNAACGMCPYPYTVHKQPRTIMPDELFSKIAAECAAEPALQELVPMAQNEPLMDPKLEARIAEFKAIAQPHQMVEVVTNGSALSLARFNRLVQSGVDLITISLSAYTEAAYQKVMQGLSWPLLMKNLDALAGADTSKTNLFLRYVHQAENEGQFPAFRKRWTRKGLTIFSYEINNRGGTVEGFEQRAPLKSFFFKRFRRVMGRKYIKLCPHAFSIAHVLSNGDVPLCANDWENRELLGNVKDNTLREIFNGPRMQEVRELMVQGRYDEIAPCKDCSFRKEWLTG